MTVGVLFLVKTLLFWTGLALLLRGLWLFAFSPAKSGRSAIASVLMLVASSLMPAIPESGDLGLKFPAVIPILPTEYFLIVPCALLALSRFWKAIAALTALEKRSAALWGLAFSLLAVAMAAVARQSKTTIELRGGEIHLSTAQALTLIPLAICAILGMAYALRNGATRNVARSVATYAGLLLGSLIFGLPLAWMLSTSFRENGEINSGGGVRWIPVLQRTQAYLDPVHPYYAAVVNGTKIEGALLSTRPNGDRVLDIRRPFSELGQTAEVSPRDLTQIPETKPMVDVQTPSGPMRALDLETLPDGRHRLHLLGREASVTTDLVVGADKLSPVQDPGMRFANYSDALEFLPPETLHGLVYLRNTATIVILSVIGAVLSGALVAYAFARLTFPGKKFLFTLLLSTMMLPSAVTLLPQFMVFRALGWIDTLKPLWAPSFFAAAFNVFMLRQFYAGVPMELEEAARIDGCSIPRTFWSISLPQIKPALATVAIWTAVASWNNFTGPLIYINSPENMPIAYAVQLFQGQRSNEPALLMAFVTMSVIPVAALFLFAQRYFAQSALTTGLGGR